MTVSRVGDTYVVTYIGGLAGQAGWDVARAAGGRPAPEFGLIARAGQSIVLTVDRMTNGRIDYAGFEDMKIELGIGPRRPQHPHRRTAAARPSTRAPARDIVAIEGNDGPTFLNGQAGDDFITVNPVRVERRDQRDRRPALDRRQRRLGHDDRQPLQQRRVAPARDRHGDRRREQLPDRQRHRRQRRLPAAPVHGRDDEHADRHRRRVPAQRARLLRRRHQRGRRRERRRGRRQGRVRRHLEHRHGQRRGRRRPLPDRPDRRRQDERGRQRDQRPDLRRRPGRRHGRDDLRPPDQRRLVPGHDQRRPRQRLVQRLPQQGRAAAQRRPGRRRVHHPHVPPGRRVHERQRRRGRRLRALRDERAGQHRRRRRLRQGRS